VGEFLGEGGNTAVYATRYDSQDAVLRLINDTSDDAAVKAAEDFVEGVAGLKQRGVPVVDVYDSGYRQVEGRKVYDYVVAEHISPETMKTEKLGTYFAELQAMTPEARAAASKTAKYAAFMEFVNKTSGMKKIGDFSPDHIVYHGGEWKVYDLTANHVDAAPSDTFNPRQTMWAKLYDVKAYNKGLTGETDLIDPQTIKDINRTISDARMGPMEELAGAGGGGPVSEVVASATAPLSRHVPTWKAPTHDVQTMGEQAAGSKRGGFFSRALNRQIDDVDAKYREFFGRDVSYTELEAMYAGPPGSGLTARLTSVNFSGSNKLNLNASIVDENGRHVGIVQRELLKEESGAFVLVNKMVKVDPAYAGRGYAGALYQQQDAFLASISRHADTRVTLHADLAVGRYAWANEGFKFADEKTRKMFQGQWKEFLEEKGIKLTDDELARFQEPEHFSRFDDGRKLEFPVYICPRCGEPMIQNKKAQVRCNRWCNSPDFGESYENFWDPSSKGLQPSKTMQVHAGKLFLLTHGDWHGVRHVARGTGDDGVAVATGASRGFNATEELIDPTQATRIAAMPSETDLATTTMAFTPARSAGMRTTMAAIPNTGNPAFQRYPIGMEVLIPRSGGRPPSHAVITSHLDSGRVRAQFQENGQIAWKDLRPETLDPLNAVGGAARQVPVPTPSEIYPVGSRVRVPRSDGSTSEGVVLAHESSGRIKVQWQQPEGIATKPLTPEQLNQVNPGMWPQGTVPTGFEKVQGRQVLEQDMILPSNAQGPAVQIDYHHPQIQRLTAYSKMVASRQASEVERIRAVQVYTRKHLRGGEDAWRAFEAGRAQQGNKAIGLGDYMEAGLGVCKQNSLALQLGMQELGINSRYVRGFVQMPNGRRGGHAWVEAEINGRWYLLDNLWEDWNLKPVDEVYSEGWQAPRGYRPMRTEAQEAVVYKPANPRPKPVVSASDPYPVGAEVWVPRTGAQPSWGRVTEHRADGKVRVDFEGGYKWAARENLDRVNPLDVGELPDDLPPEIARGMGG
jgi:hypothetical protein